ncbi:hypothetical protein PQR05_33300 [Paraburkholderia sediminicola]|uniref:Uncharacterized protein n=1 Tax=Paraburkholderia metrosideri TaxID=580937 RepID=A0ABW9E200_9BURK
MKDGASAKVHWGHAALDLGWKYVDLAGLSGGDHLVAALMARRDDINCAMIASGGVAI